MQLLVLAASGKTGTALVAQGLERGHGVTAFGRSAYGGRSHDALRIVPGSCLSADDLAAALPGHDAVVSALGTRGMGATTLLRDSAVAAADALTHAGVMRLIVISSTLVDGASWLARVAARTLLFNHEVMTPHCLKRGMTSDSSNLLKAHSRVIGHIDISRSKLPEFEVYTGPLPNRPPRLCEPIRRFLFAAPRKDEF